MYPVNDGLPKKSLDGGWVGGVSSIQVYFGFLQFVYLCKAPYHVCYCFMTRSE